MHWRVGVRSDLEGFRVDFGKVSGALSRNGFKHIWPWLVSVRLSGPDEKAGLLGPDEVYLDHIQSYWPCQGLGRKAMNCLTDSADRYGVTLALHCDPRGPEYLDYQQLMSFYERSGFVVAGSHGFMRRFPCASVARVRFLPVK